MKLKLYMYITPMYTYATYVFSICQKNIVGVNPSEKISIKLDHFPKVWGENSHIIQTPPGTKHPIGHTSHASSHVPD